jgi:PAS domain S-box-containing protein
MHFVAARSIAADNIAMARRRPSAQPTLASRPRPTARPLTKSGEEALTEGDRPPYNPLRTRDAECRRATGTAADWQGRPGHPLGGRPRGEEAFVAERELLKALLDSVQEGIYLADEEGRLLFANARLLEIFDLAPDVLRLGGPAEQLPALLHERGEYTTEAQYEAVCRLLAEAQARSFSYERVRPNGQVLEVRGRPLPGRGCLIAFADVTERWRTIDALRQGEDRFRDFTQLASHAQWEMDDQLRIVDYVESLGELAARPAQAIVGRCLWEIEGLEHGPEDAHWQQLKALLQARKPFREFAYAIRRADGRRFHRRASGRPLFDRAGLFLGYRCVSRDETPAVEARERAAAAEDLLRRAIESLSEGFAVYDPQDRLVLMNDKYRSLFHEVPKSDDLGRTFEELVRGDVANGDYPEAVGGEEEFIRWRIVAHRESGSSFIFKSRRDRWIQARDYHMPDGSIVAIRTDVTDLLSREEALRESEQRFRTLFSSSPLPTWVFDSETFRFLEVNEAAERHYGYSRDEFLAMRITDIRSEAEARRLLAGYRVGEPFIGERKHLTRDGREIEIEGRATPIEFMGRPAELVVVHDITRRKQAEEQLRHAQKMQAVGQLTGGVAHDFNNLLTVILGSAELLAERLEPSHEAAQRLIANIQTAGRQGAELTQRLLAYARRQPLEPSPIDVHRLIRDLAPLLQRTLGDDIEIALDLGAVRSQALIDGHQLETALLNLAVNARDAMPAGGRLLIETENALVDAAQAEKYGEMAAGSYVRVSVSDRGCGMTPEVAARAVEPFFTTKPVGQGTGLGLSMVFGFIKQSGGHMSIYSEPGQGTTIKLYLPEAAGAAAGATEDTRRQRIRLGSERILYVEDDEFVRLTVVEMLKGLGYQVLIAADGPAALAILERGEKVDLLFTDVVMPGGMGGRDLADAAQKLRPGLKVLFTSGYTENAIVHHGRLDAGVQLLGKPFRLSELSAKLRQVLDAQALDAQAPDSKVLDAPTGEA